MIEVLVVEHDPAWAAHFAEERGRLAGALVLGGPVSYVTEEAYGPGTFMGLLARKYPEEVGPSPYVRENSPISSTDVPRVVVKKILKSMLASGPSLSALEHLLSVRGIGSSKCMLIIGIADRKTSVKHTRAEVLSIARKQKGISVGRMLGEQWHKKRFQTPYLRNTLWNMGYAVDTVETATTWDRVPALTRAIEASLRSGLVEVGEEVHAFSHLSHLYPHGSAIYTTYLYRIAPNPQETLRRWQILKGAACRTIVAEHGTISHQHGIGTDHQPYLIAEKGEPCLTAMRRLYTQFDPTGMMNPGKLVL